MKIRFDGPFCFTRDGGQPFPLGRRRESCGFTLIEMMIVVAIIAVLAAIALPAYTKYITKTNRVAASACVSENASYMERYYTTNLSYKDATLPGLECGTAAQTGQHYTYALKATSSTYTITATPTGSQASRDTSCASLGMDQDGTRTVSGSGNLADCW